MTSLFDDWPTIIEQFYYSRSSADGGCSTATSFAAPLSSASSPQSADKAQLRELPAGPVPVVIPQLPAAHPRQQLQPGTKI